MAIKIVTTNKNVKIVRKGKEIARIPMQDALVALFDVAILMRSPEESSKIIDLIMSNKKFVKEWVNLKTENPSYSDFSNAIKKKHPELGNDEIYKIDDEIREIIARMQANSTQTPT